MCGLELSGPFCGAGMASLHVLSSESCVFRSVYELSIFEMSVTCDFYSVKLPGLTFYNFVSVV